MVFNWSHRSRYLPLHLSTLDPPGQDRETINCDFEGTDDPFCGFVQGFPQIGFEDRTDWSIGSGSTPTEGIGPENDHTLGNSDGNDS